jgi:hypothetical protein
MQGIETMPTVVSMNSPLWGTWYTWDITTHSTPASNMPDYCHSYTHTLALNVRPTIR